MNNTDLNNARASKQDEFYTHYNIINEEIKHYINYNKNIFKDKTIFLPCDDPEKSNFTKFFIDNFKKFGLKKLISTSYAKNKKQGKLFTFCKERCTVEYNHITFGHLEGDGDFRSDEIKKIRDESDFIITNPPFSLFRAFVSWIFNAKKKFLILGNLNAVIYKEIFPLIRDNKLWLGKSIHSGQREFAVPKNYPLNATESRIDEDGNKFVKVKGVRWFTNINYGKRNPSLQLMTMEENILHNKKLKGEQYLQFDNYDAINVPSIDTIPSDYKGVMGVPISFLDKYCPEQFEIVSFRKGEDGKDLFFTKDGKKIIPFFRILIRHR